jgi:osmotically-inducible protein OsmY
MDEPQRLRALARNHDARCARGHLRHGISRHIEAYSENRRARPKRRGQWSQSNDEQAIRERLIWDSEIEGATIAVRVTQGVATLEGTVRGYQRAAAERIARETPGVTAVNNQLRLIDPLRPSDEILAEMVETALAADPAIPAAQIGAAVHDGVIDLSGEVSRSAERLAAEEAVVDLPGVVDVRNRIAVTELPVHAKQIEDGIREAFIAEAAEAATRIVAQVDGAEVTLTGTTPTAHHRQVAERTTWNMAGVRDVRNEIHVGPSGADGAE